MPDRRYFCSKDILRMGNYSFFKRYHPHSIWQRGVVLPAENGLVMSNKLCHEPEHRKVVDYVDETTKSGIGKYINNDGEVPCYLHLGNVDEC